MPNQHSADYSKRWTQRSLHRICNQIFRALPLAQAQTLNRKGVTENKRAARLNLVNKIEQAQGIIMSHFDSLQDYDIYNEVNVSTSKLKGMRDMNLSIHSTTVLDLLTNHQAALLPYGVDPAYITAYTAVHDIYNDIISTPTVASNTRKMAGIILLAKVSALAKYLRRDLDKAMLLLKFTEAEFYITYLHARNVIDLGVHHNANTGIIRGVVKDETTELIIPNAVVQIVNTPTTVVTSDLGEFTIIDVPIGPYSLKFSAGGYINKTVENVVVTVTEPIELEVKLALSE